MKTVEVCISCFAWLLDYKPHETLLKSLRADKLKKICSQMPLCSNEGFGWAAASHLGMASGACSTKLCEAQATIPRVTQWSFG